MPKSPARILITFLVALFVVLLAINLSSARKPSYATSAQEYFTALNQGNLPKAYQLLCDVQKVNLGTTTTAASGTQKPPTEEIAASTILKDWQAEKEQYGTFQKSVYVGHAKHGPDELVVLKLSFAKKQQDVNVTMIKELGGWHVCGNQVVAAPGASSSTTTSAIATASTTIAKP